MTLYSIAKDNIANGNREIISSSFLNMYFVVTYISDPPLKNKVIFQQLTELVRSAVTAYKTKSMNLT